MVVLDSAMVIYITMPPAKAQVIFYLQGQSLTWNEIQATINTANSQADQAVQGKIDQYEGINK